MIICLLIYTTIIIVKRVALDSDISEIADVNKKYFIQNTTNICNEKNLFWRNWMRLTSL